jgi:D-tagatose-1,6-bisphosphate aldolase subunit GatZ/KbaZ
MSINDWVRILLELRSAGKGSMTLLAVCPNSAAVLEAAVRVAAQNRAPMLFAATLNQVDRDGGYTGWTPRQFVQEIQHFAAKYHWPGPLYPCLDHGGPWLKDKHAADGLSLNQTMSEVRLSLSACLEAGYRLLHIDPTVDRSLPPGATISIDVVAERTIDLIAYAESERRRLGLARVAYEVGTEEVKGGLVDLGNFHRFLESLKRGLSARGLDECWPCFIVGRVGTDLGATTFDPPTARRLYEIVAPLGSLIKGHYTDWVENPEAYPDSGMGGANVGPEFTVEEYLALRELSSKEADLCRRRPDLVPSAFVETLTDAVVSSGRWKKWLQPQEQASTFSELPPRRREWLVQTGARYIWTAPPVLTARDQLYATLSRVLPDPHDYVVERIARAVDKYITAFHLFDSLSLAP